MIIDVASGSVLANGKDRPNLLYLVHRLPYPPDKGDRIRAFHILRFLAQKANIHLACLADEPVAPGLIEKLRPFCARIAVFELGSLRWLRAIASLSKGRTISEGAFYSPKLRAIIDQWTKETDFHACLASASSMVPYLRLPSLRAIPAVVDLVDVDSQKWADYGAASRGIRGGLYRVESRRLQQLEAELPRWARAVTLVSEAEADLYRQFCAPGRVQVVSNGVDLDYFLPQPIPQDQTCIFLGALDYRPNVDGVSWFCQEVWPQIREQRPEATLSMVGRRPAPAVERLAQIPGVVLVGQVADVRPYLARAAVSVAPLQIARGVQNKILEAMAMGKATVVSPCCMKGLQAQEGRQLLAASSAQQWTQTLLRLFDDLALRHELGAAARAYVEAYHRWDFCLTPMLSLLNLCDMPSSDDSGARDAFSPIPTVPVETPR